MKLASLALSASMALGIAAMAPVVSAQTVAPAVDFRAQLSPAQSTSTVARYILGPEGHVRGMQLADGAMVWIHGRGEGDSLAQRLPVGQTVHIEGMVHTGSPTVNFFHATIHSADGTVLVAPREMGEGGERGRWAHGPRGEGQRDPARMEERRARMAAHMQALPQFATEGTVSTVLTGPRGHIHGVLLANNTTVMFTHAVSEQISQRGIHPGENLRISGRGGAFPLGASIIAEQVTLADGTAVTGPITEVPTLHEGPAEE